MNLAQDLWYALIESRELGRVPLGVERLGERLVLWRTADGTVHAHSDRCPHPGAALSGGKVRDDCLVCPFHGFEFGADGECRHIPAVGRGGRVPKGMAVGSFPLREAHGFVWLWRGAGRETYPDVPYFPELEKGWRHGTIVVDWPVHYTRAIENQLDVAHLPFVHRSTIGAGNRTVVEGPHVEADARGIKVWVTNALHDGRPPRDQAALAQVAERKSPA